MSGGRAFRHHTLSESSGPGTGKMLHHDPSHDPNHDPALDPLHDLLHPAGAAAAAATAVAVPSPLRQQQHRHHHQQHCQRPPFCQSVYLLPTRLATALLALLQGSILDCYLTHYNSAYWFAWIAGDVAVVMMFAVAFIISYRQMAQVMRRLLDGGRRGGGEGAGGGSGSSPAVLQPNGARFGAAVGGGGGGCCVGGLSGAVSLGAGGELLDKEDGGGGLVASAGSMPLVYFAWLVYSALLAIRVLLIYKNFAHELTERVFLGTNMLQTTVAASSVVFLLLLLAHHDASPDSRRRQRIDNLTYLVAFDLVDASDLLGVLSSPAARDAMETWVTWWVLGVACLNLVLPTLPLMALSRTRFGARRLPEYLQTLHRLLVLLGVNLPLLATRLLLWQHVQLPVSTFLVKNVAVSFLILYSFYERDHHRRLLDRLAERQEMVS